MQRQTPCMVRASDGCADIQAVLGANDGIVSTASLVVGVAAAEATRQDVLVAGVAGLVAGALSMAAGEYVSVSSQADTEKADLTRERREFSLSPALSTRAARLDHRTMAGTARRSTPEDVPDHRGRPPRPRGTTAFLMFVVPNATNSRVRQ